MIRRLHGEMCTARAVRHGAVELTMTATTATGQERDDVERDENPFSAADLTEVTDLTEADLTEFPDLTESDLAEFPDLTDLTEFKVLTEFKDLTEFIDLTESKDVTEFKDPADLDTMVQVVLLEVVLLEVVLLEVVRLGAALLAVALLAVAAVAARLAVDGGAEAPMALDASSIKFDIPLDFKAFAFSELFNPASPDCKMFTNLKKLSEGKYKDPEERASWKGEWVQWLASQPGVFLVKSDMCQFGMVGTRADGSEGPVRKPTGWLTNNAALANLLARTCSDPSHDHVPLLGGRASKAREYPVQLSAAHNILYTVVNELDSEDLVEGAGDKGGKGGKVKGKHSGKAAKGSKSGGKGDKSGKGGHSKGDQGSRGRGLVRGDDFMVVGDDITLADVNSRLASKYDMKCSGILGSEEKDSEIR
ncbi:unnamed protein product, partial [Prorocentrum cordatum]